MDKKSKGHFGFTNSEEWIVGSDGCLYRAPSGNPLDVNGWRMGMRFECMPRNRETFRGIVEMLTGEEV